MMEHITSVSAPDEDHVRQLVDHVDWTGKNPVLRAFGVKESISAVFPWLRDNGQHQLPQEYIKLYDVRRINISLQDLRSVLPSLTGCHWLQALIITSLEATFPRFAGLPEDISLLTWLQELYISGHYLGYLPQSLYQCKQLETLYVQGNQLHSLHEDIGCLSCLKNLYVSRNKLTSLPQSLYQCKQLETLYVSHNQLHSLHEDIGCLSCLRNLHVSGIKLTSLPQSLYQCKQMIIFQVSNNQLQYIHEEIGELSCLYRLDVSHNNLKNLPLEILKCTRLQQLNVGSNQLNIPDSILHSGVNATFKYLEEIRRKGSTQDNKRNIMFLGNTLAGKTSLTKSLLSGMPHLTNVEDRTHGMEKHTWVKDTTNKPYPYLNIQICDFGGHACYNITTVFFLNESSLFPVIFRLDTYERAKHRLMVGQWIEMIAEAIPNTVIILVGTHKDKCTDRHARQKLKEVLDQCNKEEAIKKKQIERRKKDMESNQQNYNKLQEMLTQRPTIIQETFAVSCKTFEGMQAAAKKILSILEDETQFPTKEIPFTWHHFRDLLSAETSQQTPWLPLDTVRQLAIQAELKNEDESIKEALRYLKLSSDILWYDDNDILNNIVFNQPNKLIEIFKALISHDLNQQLSNTDPRFTEFTTAELSQVKEDLVSKGKLTKKFLQCIWKDFTPNEAAFELLVMLMVKFALGYILPRQGNCVDMSKVEEIRIPWFLRDDEPPLLAQQWPANIPTEEQQIAIKVEFRRWAPPTLLPSLCVRIQTYVNQSHEWKNGMLATTGPGIKLLLKLITENENEAVLVYIRGKNLNTMWQVLLPILREMDALLDLWPGLIFSKVVPCPGCTRKMLPDPTLHTDRWLYEACPYKEIPCNKCVDTAEPIDAHMVYPPGKVFQTLREQHLRENDNFFRYQKLVIEYGTKMSHKILEQHLSPQTLQDWLLENSNVFRERLHGREKWIQRLLYPESGSVQLEDLEMTTLKSVFSKLLDGFPPPQNGWFGQLDPSDDTQAADLLRLFKLRDNLAHRTNCQLSDEQFEEKWATAETVIVRLGGVKRKISDLKFEHLSLTTHIG